MSNTCSSPDLSFSGSLRIFIALDPCDMRAGINTLHAPVGGRLKEDSKSGALFVFSNRRRRVLKVLYWGGTGFWILTKRLEAGTFSWPRAAEEGQTRLALQKLVCQITPGPHRGMLYNKALFLKKTQIPLTVTSKPNQIAEVT